MTRSSSAKKGVRKAVAVKVTKSTRRKYVSWNDSTPSLLLFGKRKEIVALITAPRWKSGISSSKLISRPLPMPISITFLKITRIS
jgi:hypothetical protein